MSLQDIYSAQNKTSDSFAEKRVPVVSFEVFPPKDDTDGSKLQKLLGHLKVLKEHSPAFVSLTYGAGGTTQNSSLNIIKRIKNELNIEVTPHFTCVNSSKENVKNYLKNIDDLGIKNILALRGDIPTDIKQENFDFPYANELVKFIKTQSNLSIAVAGYPEGHMECKDFDTDLKNLKNKVDSGADVIITQMFFDNDKLFNFIEQARKLGIKTPIIPGILPIISYSQFEKMLSMAKVTVPKRLFEQLEKYKEDKDAIKKIGIEFASNQCQQLIDSKVCGLHFYTLNKSYSVSQVLENLGL